MKSLSDKQKNGNKQLQMDVATLHRNQIEIAQKVKSNKQDNMFKGWLENSYILQIQQLENQQVSFENQWEFIIDSCYNIEFLSYQTIKMIKEHFLQKWLLVSDQN